MTPVPRAVLLITSPDRPGLVALTASFLAKHGANVLDADEHRDPIEDLFVQRLEFEVDNGAQLDAIERDFSTLAAREHLDWSLRRSGTRSRLVILASNQGHCLADLVSRVELGELPAEVAAVISNHDTFRNLVERAGIVFHHVPVGEDRAAHESAVAGLLADLAPSCIVLARYMRILSPEFVAAWPYRIINIHHSFLPAFVGARPYEQAYARGVKLIGATAHYVTAELDAGPIIAQDSVVVSHRDDVDDLKRRGRDIERTVLARAVRFHLEHRVLAYANRTVVFD
jgi:formyltetrahydrofolate deformylase